VFLATAVVSTAAALWRLSQPASPQHGEVAEAFVGALDANHDGVVSEGEYILASTSAVPFSMIDIDEDGVLTAWELEVLLVSLSPLNKARLVQVL
jgi:Ca2+-binding EF-hand superfamily protein